MKLKLPTLNKDDISDVIGRVGEDKYIHVRPKSRKIELWHYIVIWFAHFFSWLGGGDPEDLSITLPCFFHSGTRAVVYLRKSVDVPSIYTADITDNQMALLVHELTHAYDILEVGPLKIALYYPFLPLPLWWTTRSTSEFRANGNEILWWVNQGHHIEQGYLEIKAKSLIQKYFYPTFNKQGLIKAYRVLIERGKSIPDLDAREKLNHDIYKKFGGYNLYG